MYASRCSPATTPRCPRGSGGCWLPRWSHSTDLAIGRFVSVLLGQALQKAGTAARHVVRGHTLRDGVAVARAYEDLRKMGGVAAARAPCFGDDCRRGPDRQVLHGERDRREPTALAEIVAGEHRSRACRVDERGEHATVED